MGVRNHNLERPSSLQIWLFRFFFCFPKFKNKNKTKAPLAPFCHFLLTNTRKSYVSLFSLTFLYSFLYAPFHLPAPWLDSFRLWSCTQFWEISSSQSALLLLQPQSLYSTTLSINLGFLCHVHSAESQPYESDCGKTLFQPFGCFLPHSYSI